MSTTKNTRPALADVPVIARANRALDTELVMEAVVEMLARLTVGLLDADGDVITSPIGANTAAQYLTEQFALRDFCWCFLDADFGDESGDCPPNFEHYASGVKLRWYKARGRSHEWENLPATREDAIAILVDCLAPLAAEQASLPRPDSEGEH